MPNLPRISFSGNVNNENNPEARLGEDVNLMLSYHDYWKQEDRLDAILRART